MSRTSYREVVDLCCRWASEANEDRSRYVCITSVHGLIVARRDEELARALQQADLVTPDGMPVVWAMRSFGVPNQERVYGPTVMLQVCEAAARANLRVFLYGAREDTLRELSLRLRQRFAGLVIADTYSPPFRPLTGPEEIDVQSRIAASGASILFVGLSTPKQEKWMYSHRFSFPGVTMIGVGAAFDIHAGRLPQAPAWMQENGLEWLFRLLVEPGRLWRRYLVIVPRFLPLWLWQWLKGRLNPFRSRTE